MTQPEEIELPARRFAGLTARVSNSRPEGIGDHWRRFMADETLAPLSSRPNALPVAVYTEYESDYTGEFTLLLGYEIDEGASVPGGLRVIEAPPQKYAVVLAQGAQPAAVQKAWQWVWASALDRSYGVDFDEWLGPDDVRLHVALR